MEFSPEVRYAVMRLSLEMFDTMQNELTDEQRTEVLQRVNREMAIGKRLLESDESSRVSVPDSAIKQACESLAQRFENRDEFIAALQQNGLNEETLRQALAYELRVESVLERLLNDRSTVSDEEVEIYYYQHLDKFALPETRTARHILITVNEDYPENSPEQVKERLQAIHCELQQGSASFQELASQHSECPTAMHEGLLGRIKPGQLYEALDSALFRMTEGEVSAPIETEVGHHLLLCETIHPAGRMSFDDVKLKLREHLEQKKRKHVLKEWLLVA